MRRLRLALVVPGIAVLCWLAWTIIQVTRADELAPVDPRAALAIDPDHPGALLHLAREQLETKDYDGATATARHVLRVEPGQGDAFAVLALAAVGRGDADAAQLTRIALRRAPRDIDVRTHAMVAALEDGAMPEAAEQLDAVLRLSPRRGEILFPAMSAQTMVPGFKTALLERLAQSPPWGAAFLRYVSSQATPEAVERIYGALRQRGMLSGADLKRWLDRRISEGEWDQAHEHWLATLERQPGTLPLVYNGGFEEDPSDLGFDWRRLPTPGVFSNVAGGDAGGHGRVAHFHFIGRPAAGGDLRQPLVLPPGAYRLSMRVRGEFLHSDEGLQWIVRCPDGATVAELGPLGGSFEWQRREVEFEVPGEGCAGQWLELSNPAVTGSAQQVSGDLWVDDIKIESL